MRALRRYTTKTFKEPFNYGDDPVKICYSEKKGRYLVATKDLKAGDTLFISNPYSSIIRLQYSTQFCYHCFNKLEQKIFESDEVTERFYCSDSCKHQKNKFDSLSKIALQSLKNQIGQVEMDEESYQSLHDDMHLLINTMVRHYMEQENLISFNDNLSNSDFDLIFANNDLYEAQEDYINSLAEGALEMFKITPIIQGLTKHNIAKILLQLQTNGFLFGENKLWGCFPSISYANHSCLPTCEISSLKNSLSLKAIKDLKSGTEITVCYDQEIQETLESTDTNNKEHIKNLKKECKVQMLEHFCFNCDCEE